MPNFSGIWSATQQFQARAQNIWPAPPGAPTIGTATAGGSLNATVTFTAPADTGYPAGVTSYTVTSSPGNITNTGASSPITVSGLTAGVSYTFTVTATNSSGTGPSSASSNSITAINAPTLVSQQTATDGAVTGITISAPSSISSGNLLVAFIVHADTDIAQKFTSVPSGWTTVSFTGSNNASLVMYYKIATGSEPGSYTWSGSTVARACTGVIYNYSNASFDACSYPYRYQTNPLTLTPVPSSLTVSQNNSVVFFVAGSEDPGKTISAPSGYSTSISQLGGASQGGAMWVFYKTGVSAGSTGTPTTTFSTTGQGYVLLAVIKPA